MRQTRFDWRNINRQVIFAKIFEPPNFLGLKAISEGKLCVLVLCGGQASRLGGDVPKGSLSLSLHGRYDTLISLQAAQIVKLLSMAKKRFPNSQPRIPW
jgi:UDP-N-acetylglucosamine/UDP-N-acetylgalactosamine diphosphorylase